MGDCHPTLGGAPVLRDSPTAPGYGVDEFVYLFAGLWVPQAGERCVVHCRPWSQVPRPSAPPPLRFLDDPPFPSLAGGLKLTPPSSAGANPR